MKQVKSIEELEGARFFVYKHSNLCSISSGAHSVVSSLEAELPCPVFKVIVHEDRELSSLVAQRFDVRHESPQLILVEGGRVIWHASHFDITREAIRNSLKLSVG